MECGYRDPTRPPLGEPHPGRNRKPVPRRNASTHIRKGSQKEQRKHSQEKLCQALQAAGQSHLVHALVIPIAKSQALQAAGQSHFVHALVETQAKLLPSVRLLDLGVLSKNRQSPIRAQSFWGRVFSVRTAKGLSSGPWLLGLGADIGMRHSLRSAKQFPEESKAYSYPIRLPEDTETFCGDMLRVGLCR